MILTVKKVIRRYKEGIAQRLLKVEQHLTKDVVSHKAAWKYASENNNTERKYIYRTIVRNKLVSHDSMWSIFYGRSEI